MRRRPPLERPLQPLRPLLERLPVERLRQPRTPLINSIPLRRPRLHRRPLKRPAVSLGSVHGRY